MNQDVSTALNWLVKWANGKQEIQGILLVGSYARGTQRPDSDIDLVLLVENKEKYLADLRWLEDLNPTKPISCEEWGVLSSLSFAKDTSDWRTPIC